MAKIFWILGSLGLPFTALAGEAIGKNLYLPQSIVIGIGETPRAAYDDAYQAIPPGFAPDDKNGQELQCTHSRLTLGNETDPNEPICDSQIKDNHYRIIFPIQPSS
jgi:hypothetical protein